MTDTPPPTWIVAASIAWAATLGFATVSVALAIYEKWADR